MATDPESPASLVALRDARERAIAQLSDAFAHDVIGVDEFERRLTLAHRSASVSEVAELVSDLTTVASSVAIVPAPARHVASASPIDHDSIAAILAGVERRGPWTLPHRLRAFAVFGGMVLDFREALLPPGVTEIHVVAVMGGAQLIVPPGLSVEVSGTAIMGGFAHVERTPAQPDPERTVLRVRGFAVMGGVAVETRLPGESEHDAHRRRKRERRALRSVVEPKRLPQGPGR
jgi:hypothetical protein